MNKLVHSRIINTDSDHELIMATVKTKGTVSHQYSTNSKIYKNFDKNNFLLDLIAQPWSNVYSFTDVKLITNEIMVLFLEILNKHAPCRLRNIKHKSNNLELSKECLNLIEYRNKLKRRAKMNNNQDTWNHWRIIKN